MESKEIKATIQLGYTDYRQFIFYHSRKSIIGVALFYYLLFVGVVLYFSNIDGYDPETLRLSLEIALPLGIAISGVIVLMMLGFGIFRSKRIFRTDKLIIKQTDYTIGESGIETSSDTGSGRLKWSEVYKVRESKHSFLIYIAKNKALILPKRYLTEDEAIHLRQLFKDCLPGAV